MMSLTHALLCAALLVSSFSPMERAQAQRRGQQPAFLPNVPYDGRLTFVRVKYQMPEFGLFISLWNTKIYSSRIGETEWGRDLL